MAELRVKGTGTLKLFESDNTSSVTIASPASLGADRTVTLPDGDVTLVAGTMSTGLTGWSTDSGTNDSLVPDSASAGIYLGVAAATAANLLDDYEEGTWTPAFRNYSGTESVTAARYTKIGRMVYASVRMARTDATSDGSACEIGGLPFTSVNSTNGMGGGLINYTDSSTGMRFQVINNADYVQANSTSGTNVNYNDFGANKEIRMIIIYEAA